MQNYLKLQKTNSINFSKNFSNNFAFATMQQDHKPHAENSRQKLWLQRESDPFCDVVLIAGTDGKQIPAHRCILSAASEYFNKRFTYENESKEIKVADVDGETLNSLVEYWYTGHIEIREELAENLIQTADMLLLNNIATACGDFLRKQLHPTNCLAFMLLAERYNCQSLLERAQEYTSNYFMDVYETDEFLQLNTDQLGQLLLRDDLRVLSEEDIFNSLMRWIEYDGSEREQYKDELLKLVRMPLIKSSFLYYFVKPICTSMASSELYVKATEWHSMPKSRRQNSRRLVKSRKRYEYLMGITISQYSEHNKMNLYYYCPLRLKWMKLVNDLDFRSHFDIAIMEQRLFIVGGRDIRGDVLNTVICLNLKTMTLTQVSPMIEHRALCRAAVLNGFLYVVGGLNLEALRSVERWDPRDNTWSEVASSSSSRYDFGLVELNDKLYAIGDNDEEYYDPQTNKWKSIGSLHCDCDVGVKVVAVDGLLYAVRDGDDQTVERYDPMKNQWTIMCSLKNALGQSTTCTTFQDKVVACYEDHVDVYNVSTNEWKADASLRGLDDIYYAFSYSDQLLKSAFV